MGKEAMALRKKRSLGRTVEPYLYLLPAIVLFAVFTYYPFIRTIGMSFMLVNAKGVAREFVGLENYMLIFKDKQFIQAIGNTFVYVLVSVPASIIIALALSLMANKQRRLSRLYETMFSLPMAMSLSVTVLIFQFMLNPGLGVINHWFGLDISWFGDRRYMLVTLIIMCVWLNLGFDFLYLLAAVRGVPVELIESSSIEGANAWQRIRHVILPMISPTLFFLLCTETSKAMMMAAPMMIIDTTSATTSSHAFKTIMYYMYVQGFRNFNYSYAFAASVVGFILSFGIILTSFLFENKGVHYS